MSTPSGSDREFTVRPRLDRIFPLAGAFSYSGSDFVDMVLWLPPVRNVPLRLWLRTSAREPSIRIGTQQLAVVGTSESDPCWLDFGLIERGPEEIWPTGFTTLRVYGLDAVEAKDACVVLTPQTDIQLRGDLAAAEQCLWGLSRCQAGRSTLSPCRVPPKEPVSFEMVYTTGPEGLPAGAFLRLTVAKAFSLPQDTDPDAPGWLEVAADGVPLELLSIDTSVESHERVDVIYALPDGIPPQARLTFRYNTDFVYLFSSRWAQSERRYWWDPLPPLAVAVAADGKHRFVPLAEEHGHALEVQAGPPERLHLFAPGPVREGEDLAVHGLFTDRFRNPPSPGPLPAPLRLYLCSAEGRQDLGAVTGSHTRWYRFRKSLPELTPGVYRVQAVNAETEEVLAESNPLEILAPADPRSPIYWGEIHAHSEQSDGSGQYEQVFQHARDEAAMDFAAAADHACYFTDNEWEWMQDMANHFDEPGCFVTLNGYEWAGQQGHRNFYTDGDRLELCRGMAPETRCLDKVFPRFVDRADVVAGPHVRHVGKDFFWHHDARVQRFFEIYSMWGNYEHLIFEALNKGADIGVTGGGDCHEARPGFSVEDPDGQGKTPHTFAPKLCWKCGMTAAVIPELTRKELLAALREHRTYATTGPRILVDFAVSGTPMGVHATEPVSQPRIVGAVYAVSDLARLEVIRDGEVVFTQEGGGRDAAVDWIDDAPGVGEHWYLLRSVQRDGEMAWTSPVWVTVG